jgi:cytochrome c
MSGDLTTNKILGGILATGLAIVGLHEVSSMIFEPEAAAKPGYVIEVQEETGGEAAPQLPPDWGTVLPAADIAKGQTVFQKCQSCHKPDDTNGTGPGLNGVVGRPPASHAGFNYSEPMKQFAQTTPRWDYDHINEFITAPGKYIPGTKMTFVGLKNVEDRINVIAYLHSLNSSLPIPAPDPTRAPGAAQPAAGEGGPPAPGAAPSPTTPTATGSTVQAGQPEQAPTSGAAAAPTQMPSTGAVK